MLAKRKRLSRSPYQSRRPETEQQGERAGQRRVQLLARVEASLGAGDAPQPEPVVAVKSVEHPQRLTQAAPVAEKDDERDREHPGQAGVEVDVLHERLAADELTQARHVEDEPRAEQHHEGARVHPVQRALRA